MSAGNVRAAIRDFKRSVRSEAPRRQRIVAIGMLSDLVTAWPVDTGYSRAGWRASNGSPTDEVPPEGATQPRLEVPEPQLGESTWLCNNVEYAAALDDGHSSQMPAGTVETVAAKWNAFGERILASRVRGWTAPQTGDGA